MTADFDDPVAAAHEAGFAVFPGDMVGQPKVKWKRWQAEPQTDEEFDVLGHGSRWALVTGELAGVVVLDFDDKNGGDVTLAGLNLEPHVQTPGGAHVYVKHPGFPIRNSVDSFRDYPGMDVRGDGGIAWFSGRSKKGVYTPLLWPPEPVDLAALEPTLAATVFVHPQEQADRAPVAEWDGPGLGTPEAVRYLHRLTEDIERSLPGTSNAALNKAGYTIGGLIASGQLDGNRAFDALFEAAETRGAGDPATVLHAALAAGAERPWKFEPMDDEWVPAIVNRVFRQGGVPDPEPFPVDAMPAPLDDFVRQAARAVSAPTDYIGAGILPVLGVALGGYVDLRITDSWRESPLLYTALVGPPSARKSPALGLIMAPAYDAEQAMYDGARAEAEDSLSWSEVDPPVLITDDATIEAFFGVLEKNPRGVILQPDELIGWVNGMGQYKGGGGRDRQHWLSIWSRKPIKVNRKTTRSHYIPRPFACVLGGIQPDPLEALMHGRDDGLLPRILMAQGEVIVPRLDREVPTVHAAARYADVWNRLRDDGMHERTVTFTDAGYKAYETWANEHYKSLAKVPPELAGAWGKMDAQAARIALILSQAMGEDRVSVDAVDRAAALVRYFQGQAAGLLQSNQAGSRWEKTNAARTKALGRYILSNPGAERSDLIAAFPEWAMDSRGLDRLLEPLTELGVWHG